MRASLFNIDDLEKRLDLPHEMAERKRQQIRAVFPASMAFLECDTKAGRGLLRQIFLEEPGIRNGGVHGGRHAVRAGADSEARAGEAEATGPPTQVTLEDTQESEFAEHLIPVAETPFWNETEGDEAAIVPVARCRPQPARCRRRCW